MGVFLSRDTFEKMEFIVGLVVEDPELTFILNGGCGSLVARLGSRIVTYFGLRAYVAEYANETRVLRDGFLEIA